MNPPRLARRLAIAVLVAAPALSASMFASAAAAADWPQWRGPNRDGHAAAGAKLPASFPAKPAVAWKADIGFGLDSPVVAGGKVFLLNDQKNDDGNGQARGGREVVRAFDAATGKPLWQADLDEAFKDSQAEGKAGPRCTAVVDGDLLFAQSARGTLKCLSATDGKEVWTTNYTKDFGATFIGEKGQAVGSTRHGNTGAPVVDGEHLIAGVGGKDAGYVCFEKKTGKVVWKAAIADVPAYSAPVVATLAGRKQVVAFTTTGVIGIDRAEGKELWRVPVKTALGRHAVTPVVAGDVVVVGSFNAGLLGVKVTAAGDAVKAEQAWATKETMPNFSSPVLVNGKLYGVGQALKVFCADPATGKIEWTNQSNLGKEHAGLIAVGDAVLALGDNGDLVAFAADAGGYKELGRATVAGKNWCVPAYVDGRLYLRDWRELKCVELGK
ncbi:MAG TPA: PQQ-binding-like beta-propeller repeat protein [Humisphaera sp.]